VSVRAPSVLRQIEAAMSSMPFRLFMGLLTAPAMAFALDALVEGTIGVSAHAIVLGSLGSAACLAAILAFASITPRKPDCPPSRQASCDNFCVRIRALG
jgi:hypothetical protein